MSGAREVAHQERSKLVRNLLSNWTLYGFQIATGFVLLPLLIGRLGAGEYGVWIVLNELIGHTSILYLGLGASTTRFVASHDARGERDRLNSLAATVFLTYLAIGGLLLLLALGAAPFAADVFRGEATPERRAFLEQTGPALVLLGLTLFVSFPGSVLGATLRGLRRYDWVNGIALSLSVVRFVAILLLAHRGSGVVTIAAITFAVALAEQVLRFAALRRVLPEFSIARRHARWSVLHGIKGFTFHSFLMTFAERIIFQTDSLVIAILIGPEAVTVYAVAVTLIEYARRIVSQFTDILTPSMTVFDARGEREHVRYLLVVGTRYSLVIALWLAVGLAFLGGPFLAAWVGDELGAPDLATAATLLLILTFPHLLRIACSACGSALWAIDRVRFPAWVGVFEALANLVLSVVFVTVFDAGLAGVAWGTAVSMTAASLLTIPRYTLAQVRLEFPRFAREALAPPLAAVLPMVALLGIVRLELPVAGFAGVLGWGAAATALYAGFAAFLCLGPERRGLLRRRSPAPLGPAERSGSRQEEGSPPRP